MRPYGEGEKRHRAFCWCCFWTRGNRGRNRSSAEWWNHKRAKRRRSTTRRYYHGAARQDAKKEIARELDLLWLEQELHRAVTRQLGRRRPISHLRYLQEVASDAEFAELEEQALEQLRYEQDMMDFDVDDYQGYLSDLIERERYDDERYDYCDCCNSRDWLSGDDGPTPDWLSGDDDPSPTEASWVDLWVDGHVSDPNAMEVQLGYHSLFNNICDYCYEDIAYCDCGIIDYWNQVELDQQLNQVDPHVRADHDRNTERVRAGERFYRQNKRTVYK